LLVIPSEFSSDIAAGEDRNEKVYAIRHHGIRMLNNAVDWDFKGGEFLREHSR
jgi:hypothetical protein